MIPAQKLLQRLLWLERVACVLAFAVLTAVLFADVLSRELTGAGLHWSGQAGVYANILLVLAGFGIATASGSHLRPRFVDQLWPDSWAASLERIQYLLTAAFCALIAVVAAGVTYDSWSFDERSVSLGWPVWWFQALLPLAFVIAALRNGLYAVFSDLRPATEEPAE